MQTNVLSSRQVGRHARPFTAQPPRRCLVVRQGQAGDPRGAKMENGLFGENFGARDPFAGEIETNFGEKVLGNYNTEHIIKPPDLIHRVLGLSSRKCQDNLATLRLLSSEERELLRNQVPGWKVSAAASGVVSIAQTWAVKDDVSAAELVARVSKLAAEEGHSDSIAFTISGTEVSAQLCTASLGGLTENDFIVASKVNDMDNKELLATRKKRFWA